MADAVSPVRLSLHSAPRPGFDPTLELAATLYLPSADPPELGPGLVVGHGAGSRGSSHDGFCREACRRGFAVLALDFRGHGDSRGWADGHLEEDIFAAVAFLRAHPKVHPDMVCYRGSSMGGFYGLRAGMDARFAAMALLCPAGEDTMLETLAEEVETNPDCERKPAPEAAPPRWDIPSVQAYLQRTNSAELAETVDCPVLIVHARGDDVVPFEHSLLLARHLHTETVLLGLEGGSHTSAQHDPVIHERTVAWLLEKTEEQRISGRTGRT